MLQHVYHTQINKVKWDACILASQNPLIYAQSWYLDIVSPNWEALIVDDYKCIFPLTIKNKFGIDYLCNPFFTQQLGMFYMNDDNSFYLSQILTYLKQSYKLVEINLNGKNQLQQGIKSVSVKQNFLLSLNKTYATLFANFKGNCRRNIRIAKKNNFKIQYDEPVKNILQLFKNNQGKIYKHYTSVQYETFLMLFQKAQEKINTEAIGVYNDYNQLIAGAIFFIYLNKITYVFSGINKEGRDSSAMYILFESLIKKYVNKNFILDFEGGNSIGMASFYAGFGSGTEQFYHFKHTAWPLNFIK
jgi:hypothetical protein